MSHFRRDGIVCILILAGVSPLGCGSCQQEDDKPGAASSGHSDPTMSGPPPGAVVVEFDFGEFVKSGLQEEVFEPFDIQGEVESSLMWTAIFSPSVKLDTQAISVVLLRSGGPYEAKTVEKQFEEVFLRLTRVQTEDVAGTLAIVTTVRLVNGQPMIDELHFSYAEDSGWIESDISVQPLVVRPPDDGH